jgi:hypothetical protein
MTAVAMTIAGWVTVIVMPEIVSSSSAQFGTIGVAFALLSWLTGISFVIMGATVLSAELALGGWRPKRA